MSRSNKVGGVKKRTEFFFIKMGKNGPEFSQKVFECKEDLRKVRKNESVAFARNRETLFEQDDAETKNLKLWLFFLSFNNYRRTPIGFFRDR